ncbi:hypothetical protein FB390_0993 [Nocardia bhagyanarayanae]|uniref:Uncharacterized protein n=1 Tax=Nocardia bhagyanarayanae TaxID=1215925 RepID=A0A543F6D0_9NOCA|nr:hypothetical protein FB390_0993 [Nocardia bhagyanarayanae]
MSSETPTTTPFTNRILTPKPRNRGDSAILACRCAPSAVVCRVSYEVGRRTGRFGSISARILPGTLLRCASCVAIRSGTKHLRPDHAGEIGQRHVAVDHAGRQHASSTGDQAHPPVVQRPSIRRFESPPSVQHVDLKLWQFRILLWSLLWPRRPAIQDQGRGGMGRAAAAQVKTRVTAAPRVIDAVTDRRPPSSARPTGRGLRGGPAYGDFRPLTVTFGRIACLGGRGALAATRRVSRGCRWCPGRWGGQDHAVQHRDSG